ncbi:hypothetical protein NPIL_74401 [Nephila pilipes]|uniref:Uncharacterized protein n=1 Tax=Nephila pilipes TaxID=299642 RepID=A0A8X6PT11_NEPPI|nr:hypothetical protein NPIL_74401 [Nephila pilipes]
MYPERRGNRGQAENPECASRVTVFVPSSVLSPGHPFCRHLRGDLIACERLNEAAFAYQLARSAEKERVPLKVWLPLISKVRMRCVVTWWRVKVGMGFGRKVH